MVCWVNIVWYKFYIHFRVCRICTKEKHTNSYVKNFMIFFCDRVATLDMSHIFSATSGV